MGKQGILRRLIAEEHGGILGTLIFLGVVIAIMAIVVIDGVSIYYSFRDVKQVTTDAAEAAATTYKETRNETRAQLAAEAYCVDRGFEFVDFSVNREFGNLFEVTCGTEADTYVFKYLPYLKDMVDQQSTNSARPL